MTLTPHTATVDVREMVPRERHPRIFATFHGLRTNEALELINDHDPKPLYYQLQAELPGQFGWDYLQDGPEVWRVRITKLAASSSHGAGQCCGSCGGAA